MGELLIKNIECGVTRALASKLLASYNEYEIATASGLASDAQREGVSIEQLRKALDSAHAESAMNAAMRDIGEAMQNG